MNKPLSWFLKIFIAPILQLLFIKEIKGKENIPKRNFILASNHASHLDQVANGVICVPREFNYIGQIDAYTGLGKIVRDILYFFGGVIRLNRESVESKEKTIERAVRDLKKNRCLIIYPEGTRTRTGEIGQGKWGIVKLLFATEVPILPVALSGTFELFPPKGKLKIKKEIKINIGKPLYFTEEIEKSKKLEKESEEYKQLMHNVTEKIMEKIKELKEAI